MFAFSVLYCAISRLTRVTFHGNDRIVPKQKGVEANKRNGNTRYTRSLTITDQPSL